MKRVLFILIILSAITSYSQEWGYAIKQDVHDSSAALREVIGNITAGGGVSEATVREIAGDTATETRLWVTNKSYLTGFVEVDGSVTNEIQDLILEGNNLSLSGDLSPVDLSGFANVPEVDGSITNEIQDLSKYRVSTKSNKYQYYIDKCQWQRKNRAGHGVQTRLQTKKLQS